MLQSSFDFILPPLEECAPLALFYYKVNSENGMVRTA